MIDGYRQGGLRFWPTGMAATIGGRGRNGPPAGRYVSRSRGVIGAAAVGSQGSVP